MPSTGPVEPISIRDYHRRTFHTGETKLPETEPA